jgi:hypothetical protein
VLLFPCRRRGSSCYGDRTVSVCRVLACVGVSGTTPDQGRPCDTLMKQRQSMAANVPLGLTDHTGTVSALV